MLFGSPRRQIAITRASVASWAVILALIDQPTTRRENRSTTSPHTTSLGGPDVGNVGHPFAVRRQGVEPSVEDVRRDRADRTFPGIGGKPAPPRSCPQGLAAHQSFDAVQPVRHSIGQQIMPDPPCAIGSFAGGEAGSHLRARFQIAASPGAERSCQPSMEAAASASDTRVRRNRKLVFHRLWVASPAIRY
jgi:hypothetical protein